MASSAQQFRRVEDVTFPTGLVATLRKPSLTALVLSGDGSIPEGLMQQVMDQLQGKKVKTAWKPATQADLVAMGSLLKQMVKAAFVSPRIVTEPDYAANEISIDDLQEAELLGAWEWVMSGVSREMAAASSFPGGQPPRVAAVSPVPGVSAESGDHPPVAG